MGGGVEYVRACEPRTTSYTPLCLDLAPIKRSRPINILQRLRQRQSKCVGGEHPHPYFCVICVILYGLVQASVDEGEWDDRREVQCI
jgi:hypothetical protein